VVSLFERTMKRSREMKLIVGSIAVLSVSATSFAGPGPNAVQWSVNGHWYELVELTSGEDWQGAFDVARSMGGYLVVAPEYAEREWCRNTFGEAYAIGLYQDINDPDYSEPAGGWKWLDDTPATNDIWGVGEPDDGGGQDCADGFWAVPNASVATGFCSASRTHALVEWNTDGADWTVDDDGPADFTTIQGAIDASADGSVISVYSGTYLENVNFGSKSIVLVSVFGSDSTVIDGGALETVLTMNGGSDQVVDGFTITNGVTSSGSDGAGMFISGTTNTTIQNCIIRDNVHASGNLWSAGGVRTQAASGQFIDCQFIGNLTCYNGSAIYLMGSDFSVLDCLFESNGKIDLGLSPTCDTVHLQKGSSVTMQNCVFDGNEFDNATVRLHIGCNLVIDNSIFRDAIHLGETEVLGSVVAAPVPNPNDFLTLSNTTICGFPEPMFNLPVKDLGGNEIYEECTEPPVFGACCVNGEAVELYNDDCERILGEFMGEGSDPTQVACSSYCPSDLDGDGVVNVNDLLQLIAAWGTCP
jgi:hypothetical protein